VDTPWEPCTSPIRYNLITKQHAVVIIQLNIVTRPMYQEKFIQDDVNAPFLLPSVVTVTLPHATAPLDGRLAANAK